MKVELESVSQLDMSSYSEQRGSSDLYMARTLVPDTDLSSTLHCRRQRTIVAKIMYLLSSTVVLLTT
jgi:hypothetical protein